MGYYTTRTLTTEQYTKIIQTIRQGFLNVRPNKQVAFALILEANLGIRIGDVLNLSLKSFVKDGDRYRLDITEQKTGKDRKFTVLVEIYNYVRQYCIDNEIKSNQKIFTITTRQVQRVLQKAVDYLGYEGISTHSFRKYYATEIYEANGNDLKLVQELLQHTYITTTQEYIGVASTKAENAIQGHLKLV